MEKFSKQRQEILDVLKQSYEHPTAEEIYQSVKKVDKTVSKGTVYRNLGMLTQNGTIQQIAISNSPDRYDYKKSSHWHIICKSCGIVKDFEDIRKEESFEKLIRQKTGMELDSSQTILHGVCEECLLKTKNNI